jgi:putative ATP-binding cassette transporter
LLQRRLRRDRPGAGRGGGNDLIVGPIVPILIMAPAFFARKVEFGVVTQSVGAFGTSVAAFSLVVTQFRSLTVLAAVIARLSSLVEAVDSTRAASSAIGNIELKAPLLA